MDNGYRAITKDDVGQEGDEFFHQNGWHRRTSSARDGYWLYADLTQFRRPIARYRSIKKDDIRQEGDEFKWNGYDSTEWQPILDHYGMPYDGFSDFIANEYRRQIAQDESHYLSETGPVVDQLSRSEDYNVSRYLRSFCGPGMFDACANNQEDVAPKPEPQEWVNGLPPVGVECLVSTIFFTVNLRREPAIVKFYGRNIVVFECKNDEYVCKLSEAVFHQIKTPAQLAAEKEAAYRDGLIYDIAQNVIRPFAEDEKNGVVIKGYFPIANAIYDWLKSTDRLKESGNE